MMMPVLSVSMNTCVLPTLLKVHVVIFVGCIAFSQREGVCVTIEQQIALKVITACVRDHCHNM